MFPSSGDNMANLTQARLKSLFDYDPESGIFTRLVSRNGAPAGAIMNVAGSCGYISMSVDGKTYKAHRLAWLYVYGQFPEGIIDHIDGDGTNNRIKNLRLASLTQNKANEKIRRDNSSGFKGAKPHKAGKWQARISVNGRRLSLGYYATPKEAHDAYMLAALKHFGEFARAG